MRQGLHCSADFRPELYSAALAFTRALADASFGNCYCFGSEGRDHIRGNVSGAFVYHADQSAIQILTKCLP